MFLTKHLIKLTPTLMRWAGLAAVSLAVAGCEPPPLDQLIDRIPSLTRIGREPPSAPDGDTSAQSATTAEMEALVYDRINKIRQQEGLNPLQPNGALAEVARQYSQRMAEEDFFGHVSPTGDSPGERVSKANLLYWVVGENLFTSTNAPDPAPLAVQSWLDSPGHRANIVRSSFTETGIGVWQRGNTYYFTQLFMRPL